jgi:hypothetical protein
MCTFFKAVLLFAIGTFSVVSATEVSMSSNTLRLRGGGLCSCFGSKPTPKALEKPKPKNQNLLERLMEPKVLGSMVITAASFWALNLFKMDQDMHVKASKK